MRENIQFGGFFKHIFGTFFDVHVIEYFIGTHAHLTHLACAVCAHKHILARGSSHPYIRALQKGLKMYFYLKDTYTQIPKKDYGFGIEGGGIYQILAYILCTKGKIMGFNLFERRKVIFIFYLKTWMESLDNQRIKYTVLYNLLSQKRRRPPIEKKSQKALPLCFAMHRQETKVHT